jgi:general secretion pathway protein I
MLMAKAPASFMSSLRKVFARALAKTVNERSGFTLIEVIAALAILSLSLSALFATLSDGFYHQGRARALAAANSLAQSLLARLGTEIPLQEGNISGVSDAGLPWVVEISAYGTPGDREAWSVAPYHISVSVFQDAAATEAALTLTTLRLAGKDASR